MNIEIVSQGFEVTEPVKQFLFSRLVGCHRRSKGNQDHVEVVLGTEGSRSRVSMRAFIGQNVHDVKGESHNMYIAIEKANHRLRRVIEGGHDRDALLKSSSTPVA